MLQDKVVFDNKINSASITSCNPQIFNHDNHTTFQSVINKYLFTNTHMVKKDLTYKIVFIIFSHIQIKFLQKLHFF